MSAPAESEFTVQGEITVFEPGAFSCPVAVFFKGDGIEHVELSITGTGTMPAGTNHAAGQSP